MVGAGVAEIARAVKAGAVAADEVLEAARARLATLEEGPEPLNLFISSDFSPSGAAPSGPLAGVPVAVKDNLCTLDLPTTCGSRLLAGYRSPFEATAVRRLREAGARIVGKTNMDEFAMGSSTEHSAYGPTRNPRDRSRVPGGSSGGSAAAVAAGVVPAALGSDTGGSARQPAALCGIVGLKPTYGRISRHGLVAFASSLDQVGVLGARVADAARLLQAVAGADPLDPTCALLLPPSATAATPGRLDGTVVGVPDEYFGAEVEPGVLRACRVALRALESLGAELREVSLPHTSLAIPAYYLISSAEASSNLARFDGLRFGPRPPGHAGAAEPYEGSRARFGAEARRRILLGSYVLSSARRADHFEQARGARALVAEDFRLVFRSGVDALFTPTTPGKAFPLGARAGDAVAMYRSDAFTVAASLAGLPAISLPVGLAEGLPVGGQLIAPAWEEERLLRIAGALEVAMGREAGEPGG